MPRRIDFLDYALPEGMEVVRGDLVEIPFRSAVIRGVVLSVLKEEIGGTPRPRLKPIVAVRQSNYITPERLTILERLASDLIQSTATMLHVALQKKPRREQRLPPIGSVTVRQSEVPHLKSAVEAIKMSQRTFVEILDLVQGAALAEGIRQSIPGLTWVVVPHHHDALTVEGAMTRAEVLASSEKPDTIVILRSGNPEHASYDRNPRYDVRDFAELAAEVYGTRLVYADVSPRARDLISPLLLLPEKEVRVGVQVIDLRAEKQRGFTNLLSEPLLEAIGEALQSQKSVLLSFNRREQLIDLELKKRFPTTPVVTIEKGFKGEISDEPGIILATRFFTESIYDPLAPSNLGLIAEMQAEIGLQSGQYDAIEQSLIRLYELWGMATRRQAKFILQTWDAPLLKKMLHERDTVLKGELEARQALHYPPFGVIVRRGNSRIARDSEELHLTAEQFAEAKSSLKELQDNLIISVCH